MRYVAVSALSHEGLVREQNEDSLVAGPWTLCGVATATPQTMFFPTGDPLVVAVADGLGGHSAGEVASALVVCRLARAGPSLTEDAAIRDAVLACNDAVYAEAEQHPERISMGTTVAGVVVTAERVTVFNVGDSRVYAVGGNGLVQRSVDDNEPSIGGRRSPIVTQALGGSLDDRTVEPHLSSRPLADAARYLVCTDGLTDAIDEAAIAAVLAEHDGGRAAFELWKATIEAGAPDNVTLALVEIGSSDE